MTRARDLSEIVNSTGLSVDTDTLVVDSANNRVGIGTSSPGYSLQVQETSPIIAVQSTGVNTSRLLLSAENDAVYIGTTYGGSNIPIIFSRGGTSSGAASMTIDSVGNVGIGASTGERLTVSATNPTDGRVASLRNIGTSGLTGTKLWFNQNTVDNWNIGQPAGVNAFVFCNSTDSTLERMRIDASGNVGIGQSNPTSPNNATDFIHIGNATNQDTSIVLQDAVETWEIYQNDDLSFLFDTTNVMTLQRLTGNVGIGTSLPSEKITLAQSVPSTYTAGLSTLANPAGTHVRIENNSSVTDTFVGATFVPTNGAEQQQLAYMGAVSTGSGLAPDIVFGRRAASTYYVESMRINASGTLLMGQTSESSTDTGHIFNPIGVAFHIRDGGVPLVAVRKTDDGELVQFKKDTAVVGSISTEGNDLAIGNDDAGIQFINGTEHFRPFNMTTNAATDALMDIGSSSNRFKDLYLSGFVSGGGSTGLTTRAVVDGGVIALRLQQARGSVTSPTVSNFDGDGNYITSEVYDGAAFNKIAHIGMVTGTSLDDGDILFATAKAGSTTTKMTLDEDGNLLVGIPTPTAKLVVNGQGAFGSEDASGNGIYLYVSGALSDNSYMSRNSAGSGTTTWYIGNQSITTSSDLRLKDNIVDSQRNAVEIINNLRVVDHTWNDPSDQSINNKNSRGVWTGLIAQEAVEHIPWLVNRPLEDVDENGNKNYWHMDYGYSVPLLIKAIQEQQEQIEQLKADIAAIKS